MKAARGALGYAEVLGAAVLWGSSGIFSVHLFRRGVTAEDVALLRPVLGAVFLLAALPFLGRGRPRPGLRGLIFLGGLGGLLTGVFQLAYQMSTASLGVPTTVALLYLAPAMVVAAAGPLLGEWPSARRVALAVLSIGGVWLTVLGARGADVTLNATGVLWGTLAGAGYAGYTLFGRRASPRYGSVATTIYSVCGASLLLSAVLPFLPGGVDVPRATGTLAILVPYALLTIVAAPLLFYDGLGRIEAGRASITATIEPVVAALLATWLLGQHLTATGWLGLVLVVVGVAGAYAAPTAASGPEANAGGGDQAATPPAV
ncbi:MAG TPA: EamA family transporter [Longimicrobiales bacterium]|jgi:DME family drug/metabolite transporter